MVTSDTDSKRRRVEAHLRRRVEDGPVYVKSKFLAEDLDLSPKEIGNVLGTLAADSTKLSIERWSYTNATTWRVEPQ